MNEMIPQVAEICSRIDEIESMVDSLLFKPFHSCELLDNETKYNLDVLKTMLIYTGSDI